MKNNKSKAIVYMVISSFSFAIMGAFVKLTGEIPLYEKVFFRNFISFFIALWFVIKTKENAFGKKENRKYLIARALCGLMGVVLYFNAINDLNLADSSILNRLSPFFVTVFAVIFLKEKLNKIQIPALVIAFIGAIFVIKPKFDLSILPALSGFMSAIFAGAAYTIIRYLKDKENPAVIVFFFSFVSVVVMFPLMIFNFKVPTFSQLVYLILTGVFAALGQLALTNGYRFAPASEVSIYNYTNIIFSAIIGFFIWAEVPDALSLFGGVLIIGVSIVVYQYGKR
ncbi:DMT family transporter [Clostridium sp. DL1XJH146]